MKNKTLIKAIKLITEISEKKDDDSSKLTSAISCAKIVEKLGFSEYYQAIAVLSYYRDDVKIDDLFDIFGETQNPQLTLSDLSDFENMDIDLDTKLNNYPQSYSHCYNAVIVLCARVLQGLSELDVSHKTYQECVAYSEVVIANYNPIFSERFSYGYKLVSKELKSLFNQFIKLYDE